MADLKPELQNAANDVILMVEPKIPLKHETNEKAETNFETFEMHVETNFQPEKNVEKVQLPEKNSGEAAKAETATEVEKAVHKIDNCRNLIFVAINIILGVIVFGLQVI